MSKLIIKDNKVVLSSTGNALISNSPGTDTSDATATAEDILEGKTAYARGEKITGTGTGGGGVTVTVSDHEPSDAEGNNGDVWIILED